MVDRLPLPVQSSGPECDKEAHGEKTEVITGHISPLRDGILKFPLPNVVGKKSRYFPT